MTKQEFKTACEREMWKQVSRNMPWTEKQLIKYEDQIDWEALSENEEMQWTESILAKFVKRLDWDNLSCNDAPSLKNFALVKTFADKWNWEYKTKRVNWTIDALRKMTNYVVWEDLWQYSDFEKVTWLMEYFEDEILNGLPQGTSLCEMYAERNWRKLMDQIHAEENG